MRYRIFHDSANGWGHMYEIPMLVLAEEMGLLAPSEGYVCCLSKRTPYNSWLANVIDKEYASIYFAEEKQIKKLRSIEENKTFHSNWIGYIHPRLSNMPEQDREYCRKFIAKNGDLLKGSAELFLNFSQTFFGLVHMVAKAKGYDIYKKMRPYFPKKNELQEKYQLDSNSKYAVLNLRDTSFNPTNRDSVPEEYGDIVDYLIEKGYKVVRIGLGRPVEYKVRILSIFIRYGVQIMTYR